MEEELTFPTTINDDDEVPFCISLGYTNCLSFIKFLNTLLLSDIQYADIYLLLVIFILIVLIIAQKLNIFTRPPNVPTKLLPRRPVLQVLFKPDDVIGTAANNTSSSSTVGGGESAGISGQQQQHNNNIDDGISLFSEDESTTWDGKVGGSPIRIREQKQQQDGNTNVSTTRSSAERSATTGLSTSSAQQPRQQSARKQKQQPKKSAILHGLPDSFAPLLSSSEMEVLTNGLTADLIHAVQIQAQVKLRQGRHIIPLDKDERRPQFWFDSKSSNSMTSGTDDATNHTDNTSTQKGCKVSASITVGSERFTNEEDLDTTRHTTTRSRPMVKSADLIFDPPLRLGNVASTLLHFPNLFEDRALPKLRRMQVIGFIIEFLASCWYLLEKLLWIIESKCQVHLGRVKATPIFRGRTSDGTAQWRLSLSFTGHLLLFDWLPIPFISFQLPTFIIPQPHALMEYLMTKQPLASARLRRENISDEKIAVAALNALDSWSTNVKAVVTPPAVEVDLTMAGGITLSFEMMHGREVANSHKANTPGRDSPTSPGMGIPREISSNSLTSWSKTDSLRMRSVNVPTSGRVAPGKVFDANSLTPWYLETSIDGSLSKDKIVVNVSRCLGRHEDEYAAIPSRSMFTLSGSIIVARAKENASVPGPSSGRTLLKRQRSLSNANQSNYPPIHALLLFPDAYVPSNRSSQHLVEYDYAFDVGEETNLDAVSLSYGASHPMLKGGTIISCMLESIYAYGSIFAREGSLADPSVQVRKRNILRHLPACDFTAGISNTYLPKQGINYFDDGNTRSIPEMEGGRVMFRIIGGLDESMLRGNDNSTNPPILVKEGVKLIADFGVSSFSQKSETKVNEFPELEIFEGSKLVSTILGSVDGSITCHLRPQSEVTVSSSSSGPNVFNPLEAYEIDFSGSAVSLRIKESSFNLDHRRIIVPTESTFALKVQQSVVNMMFEGKTECELVWDFQGSSPILQTTPQGQTPALSNHEDRKQANLLIKDLRQGRLNLEVSSVGGISFTQAETVREDKVGLYDWKFFNAIVSPDDDSPSRIMDVLHDKKTMHQLLAVMKLVNFDIERAFRYFLTKVWRAKEILDEEGISDPGQAIPNYKVARLISLFLCEDISQVDEVLPIIRRIVAGNGLDVIKVKELLRKHVEAYDEWAAEMDRAVKWAAVALGPMAVQQPIEETETPPLSECLDFSRYEGIPTAKELYQTLQGSPQLPLDQSFSSLVSRIAPYMTLRQVRYILHLRPASHWQPFDLKRLRYVYSIKKKVAEISESYGGLSFMPQSFFVSIFLGEATRSSLRASTQVYTDDNDTDPEVSKGGNKRTGLSVLRQRKFGQSLRNTGSDSDLENFIMSPAGRIASVHASMNNLANMHTTQPDRPDFAKEISPVIDEMLGDSLLGPQDIAILLQAGLTSAVKGSTVVQLNQRMLLDLMASQPRSFAIAVLAELGNDGARPLASALMALCDLDQGSFKEAHRINMHNLLESWLPGLRIPNREDYLAGGRWARSSFYDAIYSVAINILDLTETYRGLKLRVQQVRHHQETDPLPIPMENSSDFKFQPTSKLTSAIESAITNIRTADELGRIALDDLIQKRKTSSECTEAITAYKEAFAACSQVLAIDKLAFQADWFKSFFRRNYDALMIKSIYDNVMDDIDSVRYWLEALRRGSRGIGVTPDNESLNTSPLSGSMDALDVDPARIIAMDSLSSKPFFMCPGKQAEQDLIDGIIEALFYDETERNDLMNDPLLRLLISNEPGHYNFTLVSAMGVITEGERGTELLDSFDRLEKERGIVTIRADTGTARSIDYNASKIEEAVETAAKLKRPYGLLGYSQGCANEFNFESRMISGTPDQQEVLSGLVCRQLLFSAANGSMHGPSAEAKVHQLITMCEDFFKYQQGYFSRAFISSTLEGLNGILDSAAFQKFLGGAKSFFPDALRQFWREAQHLPHIPTTVLRGVLETHTTPESLEMICNMLAKQSGSALHDSQVHVYDAVGHPVYVKNRNGRILKSTDMGGSIQRTHHWSPLSDEVEFVRTKRDVQQGIFDCAKDRHIFPWVDVNARFGIIKYTTELDKDKQSSK